MKFILAKPKKTLPSCDLLMFGLFKAPEAGKPKKGSKAAPGPFIEASLLKGLEKEASGHLLDSAIQEGFAAKEGQSFVTSTLGQLNARSIALYGLGLAHDQTIDLFRRFAGDTYKLAQKKRAKSLAIMVPEQTTVPMFDVVQAIAEGIRLSAYSFAEYQTKDKAENYLQDVEIYLPEDETPAFKTALGHAENLANSVCLARDLINNGAAEVTPEHIAKRATEEGAKAGLEVEVFDEKMLKKERMNLLLGVARAAEKIAPPRMVRLLYKPKEAAKGSKRVIALIGKGVTFDTGGLDLKTTDGMLDMKNDMSGAAAVLGAMLAIGKLKPKVCVVGYLGCVENAIGPHAYHPGDILRSRHGLSIEINNTDAEGRLVLADVMSYAQDRDHPDTIIDVATLTGACMVALGAKTAGMFTNDDSLGEAIRLSGKSVGESYWRLPLLAELKDSLKSNLADMKNTGDRYGGAITAALFLQEFIGEGVKWAHLDIAGPALNTKSHPYLPMGGVGFAIRTLVDFVMSQK